MKPTFCKRFVCLVLALGMLLLSGCGLISGIRQSLEDAQAQADATLVSMMVCVENNDAQGASALAYDPAAMLEGFASICAAWPVHADDEYESAGLNINKSKDADGEPVTVVDAVYIIHCDDQDYQAQFSTREDSAGSGLIGFQVDSVQSLTDNGIEPAGGNTPAAGKTPAQWGLTVFWILACVFCLITIIDIVRKKPKLWGLWILIALVFIGFSADKWSGGSRFLARFGLLLSSEWTHLTNGRNHLQLCIPIGAILYWIQRRRLLRRPAAYAVPVQPGPMADPAQAQPAPAADPGQAQPMPAADPGQAQVPPQ